MLISDLSLGAVIDIVRGLVMTLFVLSALLLMLVILLQEGKGGGLAGAFGGAGAETFGVKAGTVNKFTAYLGASFLGLALLHAGLASASNPMLQEDKEVELNTVEDVEDGGAAGDSEDGSTDGSTDGAGDGTGDDPKKDGGDDAGGGDEDAGDGGAGDDPKKDGGDDGAGDDPKKDEPGGGDDDK